MAKRPYVYQDLSWPELRDLAATHPVVVLPVGTTEQHGPHLPLSTCNVRYVVRDVHSLVG